MIPPFDPTTGKPQLKPASRALDVAPAEDAYDPETHELLAKDPRSPVERTAATAIALLDDRTLANAIDSKILPADLIAAHADVDPEPAKQTAATRRRLRLTQRALALRAEGFSVGEIAADMKISPATVLGWFTKHRRTVEAETIDAQLDEIATPLAVENLIHGLAAGDKDYTIKTLEGRGKFKRYADKGDGQTSTEIPALVIRVEHAGGPGATTIALGSPPPQASADAGGKIVGVPAIKRVEGVVVAPESGTIVPKPGTEDEPNGSDNG